MRETSQWGDCTPENLRPAIKALADTFETDVWRCSEVTEHLAYAGLHSAASPNKDLPDYQQSLIVLKQALGRNAVQEFDSMLQKGTEPAIFRAYLNLFRRGVELAITRPFMESLKIAHANDSVLEKRPVDWAKFQATEMVSRQRHKVQSWVISVCDGRDFGTFPPEREKFLDFCRRSDWRAPKFIHMEPSGNTPYSSSDAWMREDQAQTERLREALAKDFQIFVEIHLDKIAGAAHIKLAQETPKTPTSRAPLVSAAPPPPAAIRGGYSHRPTPNRPLLNYPPEFPKELVARANVVIHDGIQKYKSQDQILDLCRYVIGELTPDLLKRFHAHQLQPHTLLEQMAELTRYLLNSNCSNNDRVFSLQLEIRQSSEWMALSKALADVPESQPKAGPSEFAEGNDPEAYTAAWRKIRIVILSDKQLQIYRDGKPQPPLNYAEFGLEDRRSKKPNKGWDLLTIFGRRSGVVSKPEGLAWPWPKVEKHVQALRRVLRRHFQLNSDPIPFVPKTGFQTQFRIECHPSFDD